MSDSTTSKDTAQHNEATASASIAALTLSSATESTPIAKPRNRRQSKRSEAARAQQATPNGFKISDSFLNNRSLLKRLDFWISTLQRKQQRSSSSAQTPNLFSCSSIQTQVSALLLICEAKSLLSLINCSSFEMGKFQFKRAKSQTTSASNQNQVDTTKMQNNQQETMLATEAHPAESSAIPLQSNTLDKAHRKRIRQDQKAERQRKRQLKQQLKLERHQAKQEKQRQKQQNASTSIKTQPLLSCVQESLIAIPHCLNHCKHDETSGSLIEQQPSHATSVEFVYLYNEHWYDVLMNDETLIQFYWIMMLHLLPLVVLKLIIHLVMMKTMMHQLLLLVLHQQIFVLTEQKLMSLNVRMLIMLTNDEMHLMLHVMVVVRLMSHLSHHVYNDSNNVVLQ
jgi:hypothetical protein